MRYGRVSDMALTVTQLGRASHTGSTSSLSFKVVPDDSWLAAGEDLDFTTYVGCPSAIRTVTIDGGDSGILWKYNRTTKKLLAYQQTDPADSGGADIPLAAVADATNLSAQTLYITVTGSRNLG